MDRLPSLSEFLKALDADSCPAPQHSFPAHLGPADAPRGEVLRVEPTDGPGHESRPGSADAPSSHPQAPNAASEDRWLDPLPDKVIDDIKQARPETPVTRDPAAAPLPPDPVVPEWIDPMPGKGVEDIRQSAPPSGMYHNPPDVIDKTVEDYGRILEGSEVTHSSHEEGLEQ